MGIKIALAGNPNCGKTTLFNSLTGSTQYVGNWPGVTVEKKEGKLKGHKDVIIQDLPGIYSLSPYSMEEVVSRNYLVNEKPDVIINIIDGTNIERNLYLTTQILELNIPTVIAVNMFDLIRKNGDNVDLAKLSAELKCPVLPISALKNEGTSDVVAKAIELSEADHKQDAPHVYTGSVEHAIAHIEESIEPYVDKQNIRWYAIKAFEHDEQVVEPLCLDNAILSHINEHIADCEKELDDDAESIITNQRYSYIRNVVDSSVVVKKKKGSLTMSDKIDKVVTNRALALPIFAAIIFVMYYVAVSTVGSWCTDFVNDTLFGEWITNGATAGLTALGAPDWVLSLIVDGIIGGVGTVLGFVPQMLIIFIFLAILEDSGYMARVAFILDRIFRKFGLSGKSFIPILIGTGCGVPAIMGTRTIENEKDRRMTIILGTYLPCGAKTEIIAMIVLGFFPGSKLIGPAMYFLGIAVIVLVGIMLKKTKYFAGDPAPFVMELPAYHVPTVKGVLIHMWERGKAFMIKAGTIIFIASVIMWFLSSYGIDGGHFAAVESNESFLAYIGNAIKWIFMPIGSGTWQATAATLSAFVAKEQATSTLAILAGVAEDDAAGLAAMFTPIAAMGFMLFNCFCPPCLVAIITAFKEQQSRKWGWATLGIQILIGYVIAFLVYQFGSWAIYGTFGVGQIVAFIVCAILVFLLVRPSYKEKEKKLPNPSVA